MTCWICGDQAQSGEHMMKKSDLRMRFGFPSQDKPLFYHNATNKNIPIASLNNWRLKSKIKICAYCNNTRTQPFDRAWEQMSSVLNLRAGSLKIGGRIKANRVFPYDTRRKMINVHLYFVKLFGCHISSENIPIDINGFSRSIMEAKPHPNVYLRIGLDTLSNRRAGVIVSELQALNNDSGMVLAATWFYQVAEVVVNVMYVRDGYSCEGLSDAWHPKNDSRSFHIADCFYAEEQGE